LMSPLFFSESFQSRKKMFPCELGIRGMLMLKLKFLNMWQQPAAASK